LVANEGSAYALKLAGGDFDRTKVENYLREMAYGAAEGINGAIRRDLRELGLEDAMSRRPQHVESAGSSLGAGAMRFARTEAAKQSPGFEQRVKTWIPNTTRHASFAGETVPVGDDWPAGFAPGAAPGCKCSMSIT
jgi:hypothetical protein